MKRKYRILLKLNFISLFFIAISFISITLAWFAYSGLAKAETDIGVKAWYIEFQKNGEPANNEIVISLEDIYPGMTPKVEEIDIKNLGDSDAAIDYSITKARILEEEFDTMDIDDSFLKDKLSHDYPFHINIALTESYAVKHDGSSTLKVSISWPLDSGNDNYDSEWGAKAYDFKEKEEEKHNQDNAYQVRSPLKLTINLEAEQTIESNESQDLKYTLGEIVLFNPTTNSRCSSISSTCLQTNIVDVQNKIGDETVTLLPTLYKSYGLTSHNNLSSAFTEVTRRWKTESENISLERLLNIVSTDIVDSHIAKENLSDSILGYMNYTNRINKTIEDIKTNEGFIKFSNKTFPYLSSSRCFWLTDTYDDTRAFTLSKIDDEYSQIKPYDKTTTCSTMPILKVSKSVLN